MKGYKYLDKHKILKKLKLHFFIGKVRYRKYVSIYNNNNKIEIVIQFFFFYLLLRLSVWRLDDFFFLLEFLMYYIMI